MLEREQTIAALLAVIDKRTLSPDVLNPYLASLGSTPVSQHEFVGKVLRRDEVSAEGLFALEGLRDDALFRAATDDPVIAQQVEIETKYAGYIERQRIDVEKFAAAEQILLAEDFDYDRVHSLSTEGRGKLKRIRPRSIGQASRISGVSAADVSILMVYLRR
jgi:tRNA uridine 5-carboxymethylaminomethyl modification enzyme